MSNDSRYARLEAGLLRIAAAAHPLGTGGHDRLRYYRMACDALGEPFDYSSEALWRLRARWSPDAELSEEA